jgi:predicted nucleic-acid-binding Zn-ribbon protein
MHGACAARRSLALRATTFKSCLVRVLVMKRTSRCPKCQSLAIASGDGGSLHLETNRRVYTVYVCLDCGYEENYVNAPRDRGYALVRPADDGPFR